jgi:hypothetical protein
LDTYASTPALLDAERASRQRILSAFKHYHIVTHKIIQFVPRTMQSDYIQFVWSDGCASYVGMQGGAQKLKLMMMGEAPQYSAPGNNMQDTTAGCSTGDIIHELGHAIGFSHEQQRQDRDHFLDVNWQNLQPSFENGYGEGYVSSSVPVGVEAYDYGSIMQYEPAGEAVVDGNCLDESCAALVPKADEYEKWKRQSNSGHDTVIGQKDGLSHTDLKGISLLYTGIDSESSSTSSTNRRKRRSLTSGATLSEQLACNFGGLDGICNWENGFYTRFEERYGSDFPFVLAAGTDYDPYAPQAASATTSSDAAYLQLNSKHLSTIKLAGMSAALYSPVVSLAGSTTSQCLNFDVHLAESSQLVLEVQDVSSLRGGKHVGEQSKKKWGRIWDRATTTVVNGIWTHIQVPLSSIPSQTIQLRFVGQISEDPIKSAVGIDNIYVGVCDV